MKKICLILILLLSLLLVGCLQNKDIIYKESDLIKDSSAKQTTPTDTKSSTNGKTDTKEDIITKTDTKKDTSTQTIDKISLWTGTTKLRGANIWQRKVYPKIDGANYLGSGAVGPPYTQADFNKLAKLGANLVIISHPGIYTEKAPFQVDKKVEANLHQLIQMISKANLFVVIAYRTGPGRSAFTFYQDEVGDWFTKDMVDESVWTSKEKQQAWADMWKYTAQKYKNNPAVVGYHLMVEPNSNEYKLDEWDPEEFEEKYKNTLYDWNQFYPKIVKAIRTVDSTTPILVGANGYSSAEWLQYLKPTTDKKTVYVVHQYVPVSYTHQYSDELVSYSSKIKLNSLFQKINKFKNKHQVPVAITEFGIKRWSLKANQYMEHHLTLNEQYGFNHVLWQYHSSWKPFVENNDFNFLFGPNPKNHKEVDNKLLQVIKKNWGKNTIKPTNFN